MSSDEKKALLETSINSLSSSYKSIDSGKIFHERRRPEGISTEVIVLKKHFTLLHAISYIIGGVAGSGIFISPTGVTANVGSVGSSLIIWTLSGLFNLVLAVCYAELGTALPVAGGDYAYLHVLLGPLPAFLCLWVTVVLIGPVSGAIMARTAGEYILPLMGLGCNQTIIILTSLLIICKPMGIHTLCRQHFRMGILSSTFCH
jgi:amino acid permease